MSSSNPWFENIQLALLGQEPLNGNTYSAEIFPPLSPEHRCAACKEFVTSIEEKKGDIYVVAVLDLQNDIILYLCPICYDEAQQSFRNLSGMLYKLDVSTARWYIVKEPPELDYRHLM